jgi:hypothetical protein
VSDREGLTYSYFSGHHQQNVVLTNQLLTCPPIKLNSAVKDAVELGWMG